MEMVQLVVASKLGLHPVTIGHKATHNHGSKLQTLIILTLSCFAPRNRQW
jgi:hypothetical protein